MSRRLALILALALPVSACGAATTPVPRTAESASRAMMDAPASLDAASLPGATAEPPPALAVAVEPTPTPETRDTQPACAPGSPGCAPRAERPRVVLDASLTPTEAGLPALSADGSEVAIALPDPDPERASSSLSIRILATSDGATRRELPVLDVREALALEDDDADAATRARIERRVAELDAAFASGGFTPLRGIAITRDGTANPSHPNPLSLTFESGTRTLVARSGEGRERLRATLVPATRRCGGRDVEQAAMPASAWADAIRGILVVRVSFAAAPRCAAAAPEERVFRLD